MLRTTKRTRAPHRHRSARDAAWPPAGPRRFRRHLRRQGPQRPGRSVTTTLLWRARAEARAPQRARDFEASHAQECAHPSGHPYRMALCVPSRQTAMRHETATLLEHKDEDKARTWQAPRNARVGWRAVGRASLSRHILPSFTAVNPFSATARAVEREPAHSPHVCGDREAVAIAHGRASMGRAAKKSAPARPLHWIGHCSGAP